MDTSILQPSGLNHTFQGDDLPFQDYIHRMQQCIIKARPDITPETEQAILHANSPFELKPTNKTTKAIVLIHGLYASTFDVRDLATRFYQEGYHVRTMLLPGHGTVPGDLLQTSYQEWLKAGRYGVQSFLADGYEQVTIGGFSLGGAVALCTACDMPNVNACIALAPGIKPRLRSANLAFLLDALTLLSNKLLWYRIKPALSVARYYSFPVKAGKEVLCTMRLTRQKLKAQRLQVPSFWVVSEEDETVLTHAALDYFHRLPNSHHKMIYYSKHPKHFQDQRIQNKHGGYPELGILDISHIAIPIAPDNPLFGRNSGYQEFSHYNKGEYRNVLHVMQGAISQENLSHHVVQRLSYNPDFAAMSQSIIDFLAHAR